MPTGTQEPKKRRFRDFLSNNITYIFYLAPPEHFDLFTSLLNSLQMQFNQTYVPEEASVQVNKPMEQIYFNEMLPENCLTFPTVLPPWEQVQNKSLEKFQQDTEQTRKYLVSKDNQSSGMRLSTRRERNRKRERKGRRV